MHGIESGAYPRAGGPGNPSQETGLIHANFINVTGAQCRSNVIESSHDGGGGSTTQVGTENHSGTLHLTQHHSHSGLPPVAHPGRRIGTIQAGAFKPGCLIPYAFGGWAEHWPAFGVIGPFIHRECLHGSRHFPPLGGRFSARAGTGRWASHRKRPSRLPCSLPGGSA